MPGFEYEYDINAATGEILKNEKKADDDWRYGQNSWQTGQNYQGDNCEYIGEGKAKQIAMNHAGVTQSVMRNLKIVLDEWVYEVEFDANGYEYDYDIDAVTGEILKNEKQADSNWLNNPQAQPGQGGQNNQASQGQLHWPGKSQTNCVGACRRSAGQLA